MISRRLRAAGRAIGLAPVLVVTACQPLLIGAGAGAVGGAAAAGEPGVRSGAPVQVRFRTPRTVVATAPGGTDTTLLTDVRLLVGRVQRTRGDTIWLRVSEARAGAARLEYSRATAPAVQVRAEASTEVVPLANRALYAVGGALLGAVIAVILVALQCAREDCLA